TEGLDRLQDAHRLRQQLDMALSALRLRSRVLVQMTRPPHFEPAAAEVDVGPPEPRGLARSHPRPEEQMHERVVVRVGAPAEPDRPRTRMEAELLVPEPAEDPLPKADAVCEKVIRHFRRIHGGK